MSLIYLPLPILALFPCFLFPYFFFPITASNSFVFHRLSVHLVQAYPYSEQCVLLWLHIKEYIYLLFWVQKRISDNLMCINIDDLLEMFLQAVGSEGTERTSDKNSFASLAKHGRWWSQAVCPYRRHSSYGPTTETHWGTRDRRNIADGEPVQWGGYLQNSGRGLVWTYYHIVNLYRGWMDDFGTILQQILDDF